MTQATEQTILFTEFASLCSNYRPDRTALINTIKAAGIEPVPPVRFMAGGTEPEFTRDQVITLFEKGTLTIDPDKAKSELGKKQIANLKTKYGFSNSDLGLKN